jgi:hypothetical protein
MAEHVDPYRIYLDGNKATSLTTALADYYTEDGEAVAVAEELHTLFEPFRTTPMAGKHHLAPSSLWRDELTLMPGQTPSPWRFVVRVHLFEDTGSQPGRYLGFVSLRPPKNRRQQAMPRPRRNWKYTYLIDAELAAPAYMQRPRYHVLTTTASSGRLGVLPFRSAVYSTPSLEDRGAACMHLAVSQALHLIMGRFGCRPISQEEFRWHLWLHGERPGAHTIGAVSSQGANPAEALRVIRASCNGGGFQRSVWPEDQPGSGLSPREKQLVLRHLTDCLACGLPVVAFVRAGHLLPKEQQDIVRRRHPTNAEERLNTPHAILILGMHLLHSNEEMAHEDGSATWREDQAELPGRLIVHDTLFQGPFYEWMISDFINASLAAYDGQDCGVHMLTIGPKDMHLGNHQARNLAEDTLDSLLTNLLLKPEAPMPGDIAALSSYLEHVGVTLGCAATSADWRIICRLLTPREICQRYERAPKLCLNHGCFSDLKQRFHWAMEVRHPSARVSKAATPEDQPPALVYLFDIHQQKAPDDPVASSQGIRPELILVFKK